MSEKKSKAKGDQKLETEVQPEAEAVETVVQPVAEAIETVVQPEAEAVETEVQPEAEAAPELAPQVPPVTPPEAEPETEVFECWLRTERFRYTDPFTGISYSRNPIKHIGVIPEGSWLHCQVAAGLIKKA